MEGEKGKKEGVEIQTKRRKMKGEKEIKREGYREIERVDRGEIEIQRQRVKEKAEREIISKKDIQGEEIRQQDKERLREKESECKKVKV